MSCVVRRRGAQLDAAVQRRVQANIPLRFSYHGRGVEPVLADRAPERAGERAGLQRRDPHAIVIFGTPRELIGLDSQPQHSVPDRIARRRARPATPVREVARQPATRVDRVTVE